MKLLRWIFNFFDQIALEHIPNEKEGQESAFDLNEAFKIGLRIFSLTILYGLYFFAYKVFQLLTSWLFDIPLEYNHMVFPIILMFYILESGMTKWNIFNLKFFLKMLSRSTFKYLLIYGIDIVVLSFFEWID